MTGVDFTGEVPQEKHLRTEELIMWIDGKEHSKYRRQYGEDTVRGQCG